MQCNILRYALLHTIMQKLQTENNCVAFLWQMILKATFLCKKMYAYAFEREAVPSSRNKNEIIMLFSGNIKIKFLFPVATVRKSMTRLIRLFNFMKCVPVRR